MKEAKITFEECYKKLHEISKYPDLDWVQIRLIPEVLIEDFKKFNIGQTMALIDKEECIPGRDFRKWYRKITAGAGIDYEIKWRVF